MILEDAKIKVIKDSRGKDTLEAFLTAREGAKIASVNASVPSGKSTGAHEVKALDPVLAVERFEKIKRDITNTPFRDQREFDRLMVALDGTPDKRNLGGNLTLALSLAFARAFAQTRGLALNQYVHRIFETRAEAKNQFPRPLFNVINGGAHVSIPSDWGKKFGVSAPLDFQEFQVVPTTDDFAVGLSVGEEFYQKLGKELKKIYGNDGVIYGDEAGYVCPFKTNEEPLEIIQELINRHLYPLKIGMDAAASQFYNHAVGSYSIEGAETTPEELSILYYNMSRTYEMISLEDPFDEESFDDFSALHREMSGKLLITDDLTTTNPDRLARAIEKKSANAILVKPNQIGTLSETLAVVALAYKHGWEAVVSHRSGETKDDFIADLAVGIGAWGLKSGSPATEFRMAKYRRALELWQKIYPHGTTNRE